MDADRERAPHSWGPLSLGRDCEGAALLGQGLPSGTSASLALPPLSPVATML